MNRLIARWNAYWFPTTSTLNLAGARIIAVAAEVFWLFPSLQYQLNLADHELGVHFSPAAHQSHRRRGPARAGLQRGRLDGDLVGVSLRGWPRWWDSPRARPSFSLRSACGSS